MMRFVLVAGAAALLQPTIPQITETLEKVQKGLEAEIKEFKQVLTARQEELQAQTESAGKLETISKTSTAQTLFADLVDVQDAPMDQQLKVLKEKKYADLPAVKEVLAMKLDDGESLALKVGHFMDGHHEEAKSPTKSTTEQLSAISGSLLARSKRLQAEVKAMDAAEKNREQQTSGALGLKADAESTGIAKAAQALKFFDKAAHRKFLKSRATKVAEEADLDKAVDAIKRHDVKAVTKILDSLKQLDPQPLV